jgi:phospholipase C
MRNLKAMSITFTTFNGVDFTTFNGVGTVVHVFVKNHRGDAGSVAGNTSFASDLLSYQAAEASQVPPGTNPYLGCLLGANLGNNVLGLPVSTPPLDIPLRLQPILPYEVLLPVANVHLYEPSGSWEFNYTITLEFEDGSLSYSPAEDGIPSILLDTNNCDYSGLCREANTLSRSGSPNYDVKLASVTLEFGTHGDDKAADTQVNVHIANRLSATSSQDIVVADNLFSGQQLLQPQPSSDYPYSNLKDFPGDVAVTFGQGGPYQLPLASEDIYLHDIVLPVVYITVAPTGGDRWIFDYRVTYTFNNGMQFSSRTNNVSLNNTSNKHAGAYNGPPFPTYAPPAPRNVVWQPETTPEKKLIPLSFVRAKLNEFVANRTPPLFKVAFGNTGDFGVGQRQSFYQLKFVKPNPPPPGTLSVPGYLEGVSWQGSPSSLGFLDKSVYLPPVESESVSIKIAPSSDPPDPLPVVVKITFQPYFDVPWSDYGVGGTMMVKEFWIQLKLTLTFDPDNHRVDVLHWVREINTIKFTNTDTNSPHYSGTFLGKPISGNLPPDHDIPAFIDFLYSQVIEVRFTTTESVDPGGSAQQQFRRKLFSMLSTPEQITHKSLADKINDFANAWLLGGPAVSGENGFTVQAAGVNPDTDTFEIDYTGLMYRPPAPAGWPAGVDFTPGALANIDHIVVLMKENRSFDHMLGYLSLPVDAGGQARADIDGLKGGEWNPLNGRACLSFPFEPEDTIFSPNPPQDPQRTIRQINNGQMNGFAEAYADEDGPYVAPRIMGHHTARTVPVFDALSRDFAICNRWFASHPGPTFPNRYYELSGRMNISPYGDWCTDDSIPWRDLDYGSPFLPAFIDTIFDHLPETVSWKYFEHGYCMLRLCADHMFDNDNIVDFNNPEYGFIALAKSGQLPNISFVDPHFIDFPPGGSCDEAPADVKEGQDFVRKVVEAVIASPAWEKTLLIITYDEHGGFYDHVPPPQAVPVTADTPSIYGLRVPTFIVSPWVRPGSAFGHDSPVVTNVGPNAAPTTPGAAPSGRSPAPGQSTPPAHSTAATADAPSAGTSAVAAAPAGHADAAGALAPLHFDHTSILKTIARRFLSYDPEHPTPDIPPYLGARFAAAHDLSTIMTATPHLPAFRPFIPYTLVYAKTTTALEVPDGNVSPGTLLWLNTPNTAAESQHFRFEDAGSGLWYLRTPAGNLYLTADPMMKITQQPKYAPHGLTGATPASQHWKLAGGITPGSAFTVTNSAYPGKTLQPAGDNSAVVLGNPEAAPGGTAQVKNAWQVTSPSLPPPGIVISNP